MWVCATLLLSGDVKLNEHALLTYKDYDGETVQISSDVCFQLLPKWIKHAYIVTSSGGVERDDPPQIYEPSQ